MASGGIGEPSHVTGELFKMMTGVDLVHVPYRGGEHALTDLIAGQVQVVFLPPAIWTEHIRAGRLARACGGGSPSLRQFCRTSRP